MSERGARPKTKLGRMLLGGVVGVSLAACPAGAQTAGRVVRPVNLSLQPAAPESIYEPPSPPRGDEGVNEGAVHFDLSVGYFTDYVFRGIELSELPSFNPSSQTDAEDFANLQVASQLSWDLGKLPHPFIGVFVNFAESDPVSSFQEIRPYFGAEWTVRPVKLTAGHNTYLYPDRDEFETSEVFARIQLDDSYFLSSEKPLLSPYIYGAYDYDRYNGWYLEAGVTHDFPIEETGLTLTAEAHVAYVRGIDLFDATAGAKETTGFQHYQIGLLANYSLNHLLNVSSRYGEWSLQGFLYYTDGIDNDLRANTQLWGGAGIMFRY
ncbi:hypothetical protein [Fontivita pretiosa]|uniref:hypothetical protein n=1 Tax=Fontivita pretiosa TaxID=2989684 RepID=UPI003D172094